MKEVFTRQAVQQQQQQHTRMRHTRPTACQTINKVPIRSRKQLLSLK